MSYQHGYPPGPQYGQYGGSQGYAQMPPLSQQRAYDQSQYQQPMVAIPTQQPRHANSQNPGYVSQSGLLPVHSGRQPNSTQYYSAPQQQAQQQVTQQFYSTQQQAYTPTAYSQSGAQYGQHASYQRPYQAQQTYQTAPSQPNYSQAYPPNSSQSGFHPSQSQYTRPVSSHKPSQPPAQPASWQPAQTSPVLPSYPRGPTSSPDPLHGPSNLSRERVPFSQQPQPSKPPVSRTQQRQSSQSQAPPRPQQRSTPQSQPATQVSSSLHQYQPARPHQLVPQHRVLTAVEIPRYDQDSHASATEDMARSPKRRRSNDGHAVPVCEAPAQSKSIHKVKKEIPPSSSPLTDLDSSQFQPTPQPSVDYQTVLLSLGEEYVTSAYAMSLAIAAGTASEDDDNMYCALMSSAMACFESVLNNYRQTDPRKEARIRLRLATIMVDECENDEEAEALIGKGIALCDRSRLPDLKYALHHVSVRLTFRQHPKAALKSLDKLVQEVEALNLQHWIYTFRFLRISLGLGYGSASEVPATLKHLQALSNLAEEERHIAAQIVSASLSAVVNLRSSTPDALENTIRAMAAARTHQLGPEMQAMPQIRGLLDCLDVAYGLASFNVEHAHAMMLRMHQNFDSQSRELGWSKYGSFTVQLGPCNNSALEEDTCGILRNSSGGNAILVMHWLTHSQLYALSYLLTGITMLSRSATDLNAEKSFRDGLKLAKLTPDVSKRSLSAMTSLLQQQQRLSVLTRIFSIVSLCGRYEWDEARQAIQDIRNSFKHMQLDLNSDMNRALLYLEALCMQGTGDLEDALMLCGSPELTFAADSKISDAEKDLRALATLNRVYILRSPGLQAYGNPNDVLASIEQYCFQHPSKAIYCAAMFAKAISQTTIISTKQYLQRAVSASRSESLLLQCIGMNIMTTCFFGTAIVGDQAEKSGNAGRTLARKCKSKLWLAVASGMHADIKERCGKLDEANAAAVEGKEMFDALSPALKEKLVGRSMSNGLAGPG